MILSLKNGQNFYQWDKGRVLIVHDEDVDQVHFTSDAVTDAIKRDVYESDGIRMVDVPTELLQCTCPITACAFKLEDGNREYTYIREIFKVIPRKPIEGGEA